MTISFKVNGEVRTLDIDPNTPLLWVLRDELNLKGTKFGCGVGLCGACTVLYDGAPIRSCSTALSQADGREITTIEGITPADGLHPLQQAWSDHSVPQCGYCQSGQIMSAVALLRENPSPSDEDIDAAMTGNICRCGTYPRIREAIKAAADVRKASDTAAEGDERVVS